MSRSVFPLFLALVAIFATACMANRQPRYDIGNPLEIETFKRRTKHDSVDYIFRWRRQAYTPVTNPITERLSPSQEDILGRHGQPDFRRRSFTATTGERVDEWAWWDRRIVAQFVQRELVFEGELTDMDMHRIRYGYPRRAYSQRLVQGVQRDIWEYQSIGLDTRAMLVTFSDERLIERQEY